MRFVHAAHAESMRSRKPPVDPVALERIEVRRAMDRFAARNRLRGLSAIERLWLAAQRNPDYFPPRPIPQCALSCSFSL